MARVPWLDNLPRGYLPRRHPRPDGRSTGSAGDRQPDDLRQGDRRLRRLRRAVLVVNGQPAARSRTSTGNSSPPTPPTHSSSCGRSSTPATGRDGFVSVEVAPELARDTSATIAAARRLHALIDEPNLFVKIPATTGGVPAIEAMIAEGRSINITLIFSLTRYAEVIDAYMSGARGIRRRRWRPVDGAQRRLVLRQSSRHEVDRRLDIVDGGPALGLHGRAAVAQAKLAYRLFQRPGFPENAGNAWPLGAHHQRPLWASTSTKNAALPRHPLRRQPIGPDTVTTLPEATIAATSRTTGHWPARSTSTWTGADDTMRHLATLGVDMDDVGLTLENQGIDSLPRVLPRRARRPPRPPPVTPPALRGIRLLGTVRAHRHTEGCRYAAGRRVEMPFLACRATRRSQSHTAPEGIVDVCRDPLSFICLEDARCMLCPA